MKAYILADGVWKQASRHDPTPGPGEVLVTVRAAAVNPRDVAVARGTYPRPVKRDLVPLSDGAGDVLAVGAGVARPRVGERVVGALYQGWISGPPPRAAEPSSDLGCSLDGVLAERAIFKAAAALPIPAHLSYEEAATLPTAGVTAWNALMESQPPHQPGATVLTLGSGGVSMFAFQLARAAGLRVIATTRSGAKAERLRALGVEHVIDTRATPDWQDAVRELTNGEGADHVIEVGGATLPRSLRAVRAGGVVSLIGGAAGWDGPVTFAELHRSRARLVAVVAGTVPMFAAMNGALAAHRIRPIVDSVFDFDQANEALARLVSGAHVGKIVIRV